MASPLQAEGLSTQQAPITSANFRPPYVPCPRAWERVLVAPAASSGRQHKIWKRVASPFAGTLDEVYRRAIAELESQGCGSRKRARHESHVPVWGNGRWADGVDHIHDGKQDLADARGMMDGFLGTVTRLIHVAIIAADEGTTIHDCTGVASKHATFPDERLRWVPRKRHSTRWPIEPKPSPTHTLANSQPPVEFEIPTTTPVADTKQRLDEKQLEKRSTRRLSRRLSLFPGDSSPRKLSAISLSPAKFSTSTLSPVKRPSHAVSPKKVAESPAQSFRVNATPSKVVLESPKPVSPQESPLKSSPAPQLDAVRGSISPSPLSKHCPLIFDQPTSEDSLEPEYEIQRRRSLQSARRTDRNSIGGNRVASFDAGAPLNRRHSFGLGSKPLGDSKDRRRTLNVFSTVAEDEQQPVPDSFGADAIEHLSPSMAEKTQVYPVVKVDAGTNIDIFGTTQEVKTTSASLLACDIGPAEPTPTPNRHARPKDEICALGLAEHSQSPAVSLSPFGNALGVMYDVPNTMSDQAATSPSPSTAKADISEMNNEPPYSPAGTEPLEPTLPQDEFEYERQDPEGLPTIYEESSESEDANVAMTLSPYPGVAQSPRNASSPTRALCSPMPPTNHVAAVDELANPHSPRLTKAFTTEHSDIPELDKTDSTKTEGDSVGTPENDFCHAQTDGAREDHDVAVSDHSETPVKTNLGEESRGMSPSSTSPVAPRTPILATQSVMEVETTSSPPLESTGFTPINGRQISPPQAVQLSTADEESDIENGDESDTGEAMDADEMTEALDEDVTLSVVAPNVENDTLNLQVLHEDSETEMLRKFVTRVAADKNAKAAAAAAALAKKSARPKRRSGSTGSTTSATGSPIAKSETPGKRTPLGEKSANSPSPVKKRKFKEGDDLDGGKDDSIEVSEDPADAPRLKRRRKRMDPVLKAAEDGVAAESEAEPGPRRSTRTRGARVALKPTAPSANSIALSLIPVRLPGMAGMDDAMLESHLAAAKNRGDEKDVAAVTRVNTRKNKGNSIPPKLVLARQAEDPAGWRMKELKSVFDAKESRAAGAKDESDGRQTRKGKGVRWAEELVRFQGEEAPSVFRSMASSLLADIMGETADDLDELAPSDPPVPVVKEEAEKPAGTPAKKMPSRRTRSSKLLAPTPVKLPEKKVSPIPAPTIRSSALPKPAASASVVAAAAAAAAAPTTRPSTAMATRRSKIAKLGMGVNGTPAPKRRGKIL
ncbi:hypothetical protein QBC47DRAFT_2972 [Echria macrotheca]|uniref:Uncharacterized protein n=1 Tax=Echria macrotheca TaxID=438768 RepID=A0AAJ0FFU3_9PEZI|nr:hypothetical protein QBC47DRAFT_2972 [Echria macrotheca]